MRQSRPLYLWGAGVEPNNPPQSDPESAERLWRNQPSSSGTCRKTTFRRVGGFMGFDATETYLIPPRSWSRAQQPSAIRSRIGPPVMEESAIEVWDRQHTIQYCNFMNKGRGGMDCTPLGSWRRAQWSPAIGSRIGPLVVEESDIELWERQRTSKDNPHHNGQRFHGCRCDRDVLYTSA